MVTNWIDQLRLIILSVNNLKLDNYLVLRQSKQVVLIDENSKLCSTKNGQPKIGKEFLNNLQSITKGKGISAEFYIKFCAQLKSALMQDKQTKKFIDIRSKTETCAINKALIRW